MAPDESREATLLQSRRDWPELPYKGLEYYGAKDARLFSQRETDIAECAQLLGVFSTKLLLLHGRSGSGKSSFIRAGLFPRLEADVPVRDRQFHFLALEDQDGEPLVIRCTDDPSMRIVEALLLALDKDPVLKSLKASTRDSALRVLHAGLMSAPGSDLGDAVLQALDILTRGIPSTLVLTIDQGEEILTQLPRCVDGDFDRWRAAWLALQDRQRLFFSLLQQLCFVDFDVKVIIALRTEYYGQFCDKFRIVPNLTITAGPRSGVQQYMLGSLLDEARLAEVIRLPTQDDAVGAHGSAHDRYGFKYEPGLAERIARDVLATYSETNPLPVLQLVCKDLHDAVVVRRGRQEITAADYTSLKGTAGVVESYIIKALRAALHDTVPAHTEESSSRSWARAALHRVTDKYDSPIDRWRRVLVSLVGRHPGGTFTTLILPEQALVEIANRKGVKGDVANVLRSLTGSRWPLLRFLDIRGGNPDSVSRESSVVREYSLAHDALAVALSRWADSDVRLEEFRRKQRTLMKHVGLSALATVILFIAALMAAGASLWTLNRERATVAQRLERYAADDANHTPARGRVLALLQSLSMCSDWACTWLHDQKQARETLKDYLLRLPSYSGLFSAAGVDDDGNRLAFVDQNGKVSVRDVRTGDTADLGHLPGNVVKAKGWGASLAGFVADLPEPVVVYRGNVLLRADNGEWRSSALRELLPKEARRPTFSGFANLDIGAGGMRWTAFDRMGEENKRAWMTVLFRRTASPGPQLSAYFKSALIPWHGKDKPFAAVFSPDNAIYAFIESSAFTVGNGAAVQELVLRGLRDGKTQRVPLNVEQQQDTSGPMTFVPSIAFTADSKYVAVREAASRLRVVPVEGAAEAQVVQVDTRGTGQPANTMWINRPSMAIGRNGSDWVFAWRNRGSNSIILMRAGQAPQRLMSPFPLPEGMSTLDFSSDGRFLFLRHISLGAQKPSTYVRVWDLDMASRKKPLDQMSLEALTNHACHVIAPEDETDTLKPLPGITTDELCPQRLRN